MAQDTLLHISRKGCSFFFRLVKCNYSVSGHMESCIGELQYLKEVSAYEYK